MFCKNCGQQLGDDAEVCIHCGTAVERRTALHNDDTSAEATTKPSVAEVATVPAVTNKMFCSNCGQEINKNADVCVHCGVAVAQRTTIISNKHFCANCGNELNENADICLKCGVLVKKPTQRLTASEPKPFNTIALVGFILSVASIFVISVTLGLLSIAGMVLSAIGLKRAEVMGGKGFAVAGLAIGIVFTVIGLLVVIEGISALSL